MFRITMFDLEKLIIWTVSKPFRPILNSSVTDKSKYHTGTSSGSNLVRLCLFPKRGNMFPNNQSGSFRIFVPSTPENTVASY